MVSIPVPDALCCFKCITFSKCLCFISYFLLWTSLVLPRLSPTGSLDVEAKTTFVRWLCFIVAFCFTNLIRFSSRPAHFPVVYTWAEYPFNFSRCPSLDVSDSCSVEVIGRISNPSDIPLLSHATVNKHRRSVEVGSAGSKVDCCSCTQMQLLLFVFI